MKELIEIRTELKAPKNQRNNFGKYNYRSAEDILEAVKPLLKKYEVNLILTDEVKEVGEYMYTEATARLFSEKEYVVALAQAGIDPNAKGVSISQAFGVSSSYARKYALSGLFCLDDTKDADATNTHGKAEKQAVEPRKHTEKEVQDFITNMQKHELWELLTKEEQDSYINNPTDAMQKALKVLGAKKKKESK